MTARISSLHAALFGLLLLCLPALAAAQGLGALDLAQSHSGQNDAQSLRDALNHVIRTLQDDRQRRALLSQLKQLRRSLDAQNGAPGASAAAAPSGLLGALSDSFSHLSQQARQGGTPLELWRRRGERALADARRLITRTRASVLVRDTLETLAGLAAWLAALAGLSMAARRVYRRRGWPLDLPPEPRPWMLVAHFGRRVFPWLATFAGLLAAVRLTAFPMPTSAIVLVAAYVALCGRLLSTVFDVVTGLFTRGHRRVAVAVLHDKALGPLFTIGVLVAFGDAVNSARLSALLGSGLAHGLSILANMLAGLISGALILRIRRPVGHLIRNRSLTNRRRRGDLGELLVFASQWWHVPALLTVGASLLAMILAGGRADAAFARATICTVLLVLTLVVTGVIRRQHERVIRRRRRRASSGRLRRLGFSTAHAVAWAVFAELAVHVWGFSLFGLGMPGVLGARVGHALLGVALTVVVAWVVWIAIDTALERALHGGRNASKRRRNTNRAQTITPMVRNLALFVILIIAGIVGLANLGVNVTPFLAGAGVIGIALGFGAQTLVQDLITGIFILIEDSLAVGDFVEINGSMGTVEGLNLRAVRLRDLDGVIHITTFSHIDAIHNMSRQFGIALMKIRLPFDLRIDDAIELMRRTAADLHRDPFMRGLIRSHLEIQGIHEFADGCPILRMRLRTAPEYQWDVARAFNLALKRRMEQEYINLGAPRLSVAMEASGGARYDRRGRPADDANDSAGTTVDWPTDGRASPEAG